jgi:2-methylcitrate dehydratase
MFLEGALQVGERFIWVEKAVDKVTEKLTSWTCSRRFDELPHSVGHEVKRRLIDSLGCALGAYNSSPARIAREMASRSTFAKGASVLGLSTRTSPDLASFANGIMVRYLDYNDTYLSKEPAHPSDNISAALAVAETERASIQDLMMAIMIGYEIQCRLADAASLRVRGWDHVTYGAISTACLTSYLLGLDPEQTRHAIGLAAVANVALRQTRVGELSMWKACAFPNAARNGVFAAYLAKVGMSGPSDVFAGQFGFFRLVSGEFQLPPFGGENGAGYMITETYVKSFPAEYHSQTAISAALALRKQLGSVDEIDAVEIRTFDAAADIIGSDPEKWRPTTRETADHSLPYCVAVALTDGGVTLNSFSETRIRDQSLLGLVAKTKVERDPDLSSRYPEANPNEIRIRLKSGRELRHRVDYAPGHSRNRLTDEQLDSKFVNLAAGALGSEENSRNVLTSLWGLEKMGKVDEIMANFRSLER